MTPASSSCLRKSVCPSGQSDRLLEGHEEAKAKWQALVEGEEGFVLGFSKGTLARAALPVGQTH